MASYIPQGHGASQLILDCLMEVVYHIVYMLQRTQIMLDQNTKTDLELLSQATGKSISLLIREYLSTPIKKERRKVLKNKAKVNTAKVMLEMAKRAEQLGLGGPRDLAINHDYYLYGAPKVEK